MRGLSSEQLLAIADDICATYGGGIRDFEAVVACASVTTARIHGVPVHRDSDAACRALERIIVATAPLTGRNDVLATVAARVLKSLND